MTLYRYEVRWFNHAEDYGFLGRDGGAEAFAPPEPKNRNVGEKQESDTTQRDKWPKGQA